MGQSCLSCGMGVYFFIDLLIPHDYIGQYDHRKGTHDLVKKETPQALERDGAPRCPPSPFITFRRGICFETIPAAVLEEGLDRSRECHL